MAALGGALWRFWSLCGYWEEGQKWLNAALEKSADMATPQRARALDGAGLLAWYRGDRGAARAFAEESLALCRQLGDKIGAAHALRQLGHLASAQGDPMAARRFAEEDLAL